MNISKSKNQIYIFKIRTNFKMTLVQSPDYMKFTFSVNSKLKVYFRTILISFYKLPVSSTHCHNPDREKLKIINSQSIMYIPFQLSTFLITFQFNAMSSSFISPLIHQPRAPYHPQPSSSLKHILKYILFFVKLCSWKDGGTTATTTARIKKEYFFSLFIFSTIFKNMLHTIQCCCLH